MEFVFFDIASEYGMPKSTISTFLKNKEMTTTDSIFFFTNEKNNAFLILNIKNIMIKSLNLLQYDIKNI